MSLAYDLRPEKLDDLIGQEHLVGRDKIIRLMIEKDQLSSMIFWGPPGSGKTSLAAVIANEAKANFYTLSGVSTGKEDLFKIVNHAKEKTLYSKKTIVFIDEIHRWNKAQQDALLPYVESGLITLIGATTENPSFEINSALLSRCRVFVLNPLSEKDLLRILDKALSDKSKGLGAFKKNIDQDTKEYLIRLSGGDCRVMLNALEISVMNFKKKNISKKIIEEVFQTKSAGIYDKKADEHYNIISAFIKSMRGSDPDAALYYLARMLESGEDPKFIARRMIIFASEDIGLMDRGALIQANAGFEAVTKVGLPEAQLILAHICIYLSTAKKSRSVTDALGRAKASVYEFPNEPIPLHLRNAPTKLMKKLGYAKGYSWDQGRVGVEEGKTFLPEKLKNKKFFTN